MAVKWDDYESGSETNPDRWNKMSILSGSEKPWLSVLGKSRGHRAGQLNWAEDCDRCEVFDVVVRLLSFL